MLGGWNTILIFRDISTSKTTTDAIGDRAFWGCFQLRQFDFSQLPEQKFVNRHNKNTEISSNIPSTTIADQNMDCAQSYSSLANEMQIVVFVSFATPSVSKASAIHTLDKNSHKGNSRQLRHILACWYISTIIIDWTAVDYVSKFQLTIYWWPIEFDSMSKLTQLETCRNWEHPPYRWMQWP